MSEAQPARLTDQDISDAYIYLLGRLLVTRQQQLDFQEGFKWNELVHRKPGAVDWPNPNLDVAYSEAWVAVDESSCTIVTVPKVEGRYYTVHFLNGWGETIANINERLFPKRPFGEFAMCLRGANVAIPAGATRIDLPVKYSRVLARVELGSDPDAAIALQHQFKFRATGTPKLPEIPKTPIFELEALPGVEAFEAADIALDSEPDLSVGLEAFAGESPRHRQGRQGPRRARARRSGDPHPRVRRFGQGRGHHRPRHGAERLGPSRRRRRIRPRLCGADLGRQWRHLGQHQAGSALLSGGQDQAGADLSGDNVYTLTFPKDGLPAQYATFFWSVIAVDGAPFPRAAQSDQPVSAQQPVEAAIRRGRFAHACTSPTRSPPTRPTAIGCRRRKDRSIA